VNGVKTKTVRNGFFSPKTTKEIIQLRTIKKQLNNALYATTYEVFSSQANLLTDHISLEVPHNHLHNIIGGDGGNMSDISISAFDPIFWLHHCNMDRHFYTWLYINTDHFKTSIYPKKIMEETYQSTQAPFFKSSIYDHDFKEYKYGWTNNKNKYMLLKDMLHVEELPFTYDIIKPTLNIPNIAYVELVNIPVPIESVVISVYIYSNKVQLNRNFHYAGSASWFGINRTERFCQKCDVTRTNIRIDIDEYMSQFKGIDISDYNVVVEGEGKLIKELGQYKIYNAEELIKDGTIKLII
jgi:hypothetical protein